MGRWAVVELDLQWVGLNLGTDGLLVGLLNDGLELLGGLLEGGGNVGASQFELGLNFLRDLDDGIDGVILQVGLGTGLTDFDGG